MDRIFVQIASYRDKELPFTIESCLDRSRYPDRLSFGICWQYDEATMLDLDQWIGDNRFRIEPFYYRESRGCCWARHRTNRLYRDEMYTLQIDSHTRFAQDWDEKCIEMLGSIDHDKPLLTIYPPPYRIIDGREELTLDRGIQRLKMAKFRRNLTTMQSTIPACDTTAPGKSPFLAAGMIFTLGRFCREVEYDPNMYFEGEEISLAVRAYTWGYNFYYPNEDLLWHYYDHDMPLHWSDHALTHTTLRKGAIERLQHLVLGRDHELIPYGLGPNRTLEEFETYADICFRERAERQRNPVDYLKTLQLNTSEIDARDDYQYWIFCLLDEDDEELYRYDIKDDRILTKCADHVEIQTRLTDTPVQYLLWPYSSRDGFGPRLVYPLEP
ncbi:MAG: glycosyl transferase [marine bacterium B5-7]|nr:MAG: glycosyl transferase [marine bacterium B5-7]